LGEEEEEEEEDGDIIIYISLSSPGGRAFSELL